MCLLSCQTSSEQIQRRYTLFTQMIINVLLKLKVLMVKMIASILPQLHVGCVDPKFICKDPEVVKIYLCTLGI